MNLSASPENNWKKERRLLFAENNSYFGKNPFFAKSHPKCFYKIGHWTKSNRNKKTNFNKTKFEDLQNHFILALNARMEMPRTQILSKIWFVCKITSTKKWFFRTIRLNIWCKRLGNLRNRIWKQPPSSSREIESTFWKDRTLFHNIFALPSQNHIKHDTLYTLDWIFLIKGLFEPKYHTWIQLKVRAKPRTTFFSERSPIRQIHIKEVAITFPTSFHNLR